MKILLMKALKAPLDKKIFLFALIMSLPAILGFLFNVDLNANTQTVQFTPIAGLVYLVFLFCSIYVSGYSLLFGRRYLKNQTPLFPNFSWGVLLTGLRILVFGLAWVALVLLIALVAMLLYGALPTLLAHVIFAIIAVLACFYAAATWARFMDNLGISVPFQFSKNFILVRKYWWQFIRILLFNIGVMIILFIPIYLGNIVLILLAGIIPLLLYPAVYGIAVLQAYSTLVGINVFAQGAQWILDDARAQGYLDVQAPKTPAMEKAETKTVKKASAQKTAKKSAASKTVATKTVAKTPAKPVAKAAKKAAPKVALKKAAVKAPIKKAVKTANVAKKTPKTAVKSKKK